MLQSGGKGSLNASSENNGNGCSIGGDSEINAGNIVIHSCAHTQNTKGNSSSYAQSRLTEFALAFEYDD